MGKARRVDQMPIIDDDSLRSVEMGALNDSDDFSLRIDEDNISQMYGNTGASVAVSKGTEEFGRHEHLMKSGPLGKCNDPFCQTCPSYFGYSEQEASEKKAPLGSALRLRKKAETWRQSWILNPHTKFVNQWNKVFCISSLIAVFIDPLFFFLLSVKEKNMCLVFNNNAAVTLTVVRTVTDTIHVCHIFLQFRLAYIRTSSNIPEVGEVADDPNKLAVIHGAVDLEDDPKKIAIHYLKHWFLMDVFTALPLPQILIWTVVRKMLGRESGANYAKNVLRVVVLLQNIPRGIRFFPLLIGRTPTGFVFETAWANFVINLLMYVLAGHIVGSCWYLFGLQRVNFCLEKTCSNEKRGFVPGPNLPTIFCHQKYLDCGSDGSVHQLNPDPNYDLWHNYTSAGNTCITGGPTQVPPTFAYGIYVYGIPLVLESSIINKYIYSIFWGFQQISTLGGNLVPSPFVWEVLFTFGIVALGLLLFALLIGNMQNFLQALQRRKLDMQLKRYDTETWMKQRGLHPSLQNRVKDAGRFRWVATGGVEEQELIKDLPEDLQKDIKRYLCLKLVKKVRLFELLEDHDHVLDAICERLYQKLYIEKSEIFKAKKPVERMLFVVRGQLESRGDDGSVAQLKEGDFCGEELLSWYIDRTGVSTSRKLVKHLGKHPLSSRTVTCLTSVEGYSLDSEALEYITTHYKAAFRSPRVQGVIRYLSLFWRSLAATRIQKAWRSRKERREQGSQPRRERGPQTRAGTSTSTTSDRRVTRFATMNSRT